MAHLYNTLGQIIQGCCFVFLGKTGLSEYQQVFDQPFKEGGVGIFGFGHFLHWFFGFRTKKLWFFGFGVSCGLWVFLLLAFGFRFLANVLAVFQIWQSLWFSVFPFGVRVSLSQYDLNYALQPLPKTLLTAIRR